MKEGGTCGLGLEQAQEGHQLRGGSRALQLGSLHLLTQAERQQSLGGAKQEACLYPG